MTTIVIQEQNQGVLAEIKAFLIQKNVNFSIKNATEDQDTFKMNKEQFKKMLDEAENQKSDIIVNNKEELSNLFKSLI